MRPTRLARAEIARQARWGWVEEGRRFRPLTAAGAWPETFVADGPARDLDRLTLLPAAAPSKIICVGRNYRKHAAELGNEVPAEPLLFMKPPSSLLASGGTVLRPLECERLDFEGEVGVLLGRRLRRADPEEAAEAVGGVTPLLDMTARDIQRRENKFTRGKGYDTFCPVGPLIRVGPWTGELRIRTRVNGELRQDGNTADMVFGVPELLSFISGIMTLEPGDLVATGTPEGVGPVEPGDSIEVELDGVAALSVNVASAAAKEIES